MKNLMSYGVSPLIKVRDKFYSFAKNSRGVAAVEFALIAPILLILFVGTVEISLLVSVDRKLSRTSSTIADLIAQGEDFNSTSGQQDLRAIFGVTERIMYPYSSKIPCVVISVVHAEAESDTNGDGTIDGDDTVIARVVGSVDNKTPSSEYPSPPNGQCDKSSSGLAADENARQKRNVGDLFVLPSQINTHNSDLVVAEVEYDHKPIVGFIKSKGVSSVDFNKAAVALGDRIYLRPRGGVPNLN